MIPAGGRRVPSGKDGLPTVGLRPPFARPSSPAPFAGAFRYRSADPRISCNQPPQGGSVFDVAKGSVPDVASVTGHGLSIPHLVFGKHPFAGVVLLSGVGAKPPPDGV
jgi:hypothetical protein